MWDAFQEIIKEPTFGVVLGLVGFLIGNRFALNRDKRKEFNNLIEPLRLHLIEEKSNPSARTKMPISHKKAWPTSIKRSSMITVTLIREKLPIWKRKGFDRAVENYDESKSDENRIPDNMGGFDYKDTAKIVHAINNLLQYLKPK